MMKEKIMSILAECTDKEIGEIDISMEPVNDLGLDSVRLVDFILQIEYCFDIGFNDFSEISQHMSTVEEMIEFICMIVDAR